MATSINGQTGNITKEELIADLGDALGGGGPTSQIKSGRFLTVATEYAYRQNVDFWGDNVMTLTPVIIKQTTTFDAIAFGIANPGSHSVTSGDPRITLGVYADNSGRPQGAPLVSSSPLSPLIADPNVSAADVMEMIDLTLQPGRYWLAYSYGQGVWDQDNDWQPQVSVGYPTAMPSLLGVLTVSGVNHLDVDQPTNGTTIPCYLFVADTAGSLPTLDNPDDIQIYESSNMGSPVVALRVA